MKRIIIFTAIFALLATSMYAQDIEGRWAGILKLGGVELRLNFEVTGANGGFVGMVQSPDQSKEWAVADQVKFVDGELVLTVTSWAAVYKGRLDGNVINGELTQFGVAHPLDLERVEVPESLTASAEGRWTGVIGGTGLASNFEITAVDGGFTGIMQSPYQSPQWFNADTVIVDGGQIVFSRNSGVYKGRFDGESINGILTHGGKSYPLVLERGEVKRPQLPIDQPYNAEDVTFANDGITLSGTLTTPVEGARRAVVLLSGSGPQNRDEELAGHKPFLVLSDYLTRHDIAVLRYDDRGVACSGGDFNSSDQYDFAKDAQAAVEFLRGRGFSEVGVVGHSEGGMVAFILAVDGVPDFIVSMAGLGVDRRTLLDSQRAAILRAAGADEIFITENNKVSNSAQDIIFAGGERAVMLDKLRKLFVGTPLAGQEETSLAQMGLPWMRSIALFDPAEYYPKIKVPVLAINGGKDLQVLGEMNLSAIKIGMPHATIKLYPELNHLFQTAPTGRLEEYVEIEETFNEQVMRDIAEWIAGLSF